MSEFEPRDVSWRIPALIGGIVAAITASVIVILHFAFPLGPGDRVLAQFTAPPPPGLESAPPSVMTEFAQAEQKRLTDLKIQEAMERIARGGIKDWPCENCR